MVVGKIMQSRNRQARIWNLMTAATLIATVVVLTYYVVIGVQPANPLNLFPPPTVVGLAYIPETMLDMPATQPTPRPASSTPGATATDTPTPPASQTPAAEPLATATGQATLLPTSKPTFTPSPTRSPFTFTAAINYQVHPVFTCEWAGVAGTVTNLKGQAARGYVVLVTGADGSTRQATVGSSPDYGTGGWEVRLGGRQATGIWRVELYAQANLNKPVSDAYEITLQGQCQKNLAFVRFQQNH